jgi:general secretion pathway protein I
MTERASRSGLIGETRRPRRVSPNVKERPSTERGIRGFARGPHLLGPLAKPGTNFRCEALGRASSGFTLLEVMIAVAILGLGLTVILTAQTGLFSSSKRAATMSQAVGLARCKMGEIEEELLREGFQLTGADEEGPCCEDEETQLRCKWSIIPVVLPDLSQAGSADAGAGTESPGSSLDALGEASDSLGSGDTAGAISGLSGEAASGGPSMGASALAPMAMGLIYPQLKGMLEASIRKVTVRVVWSEGPLERDVTVTQYITNPQQGGLLSVDESMAGGAGGGSGTGTPRGTGGRGTK